MAASSDAWHESIDRIRPETADHHRAFMSLAEELEAVDWYDQRIDAANDAELKGILAHNRDEEKEHASMVLEWIRRQDPAFDRQLRDHLFTSGPIVTDEGHGAGHGAAARGGDESLCIGSLKGTGRADG